jgi:hypothetical protein
VQEFEEYVDEMGFIAPLPASDGQRRVAPEDFPTGPEINSLVPDFEITAADGRKIRLSDDLKGSKAVVTFFRSVVW